MKISITMRKLHNADIQIYFPIIYIHSKKENGEWLTGTLFIQQKLEPNQQSSTTTNHTICNLQLIIRYKQQEVSRFLNWIDQCPHTTRNLTVCNDWNHFGWLKRLSKTLTEIYVKNFFLQPMQLSKKMLNLYQRLMNVEVLLKTTEIHTHRCRLKYAYYFYSHVLNQW